MCKEEKTFIDRLRDTGFDVEGEIARARLKDKERANERIPRRTVGAQEKDMETIQIASRLAKAVVAPTPPDMLPQVEPEKYIQDFMYEGLPEPGKILVEEVMKVLYLNNLSPHKYTVSYWCKVFSMEPQMFRTIISYLAFPLSNKERTETKSILAFVDVEANLTLEQLEDLGSTKYMKFLEAGKSKTLVPYEEQQNMIDIDKILKEDKVLQEVDKEMNKTKKTAKEKGNTHHLLRDQQNNDL